MSARSVYFFLLLLRGLVFLFSLTVQADNTMSQLALSVQETKTQTNQIAQIALQWNLQPEEWLRYKELMAGPLGIYSPGIDPLTALGISARSNEERRHYAELQVMAETQRVERELAYQRAYDEAFKRLYPNLLPVDFNSSTDFMMSPFQASSKRLAVFVKENCRECDVKVQQLQQEGQSFDIYVVDSNNDDAVIRKWATRIGIDPKKVFSRDITLNHDAGRWFTLGVGGSLPAVMREEGGQWLRQ